VQVTGAAAGGTAFITLKAPPNTRCILRITLPQPQQGAQRTLQRVTLPAQVTDTTGQTRWSWVIPPEAPSGTGQLQAVCEASGRATTSITLGP
jgi:hypothetical protein